MARMRPGIRYKLRREFNPAGVTGLRLWHKADDLRLANSATVSSWVDSSRRNGPLVSSGSTQPLLIKNAVSNHSGVRFDGSNDVLTVATIGTGTQSQPSTYFVVFNLTSAPGSAYIFDGIDTSNRNVLGMGANVAGEIGMYAGTSGTGPSIAQSVPSGFIIMTAKFNDTNSKLWRNGGTALSGSPGNLPIIGLVLGARFTQIENPFAGDIAEFIMYNADVSLIDINRVGAYLAAKYNIAWSIAV